MSTEGDNLANLDSEVVHEEGDDVANYKCTFPGCAKSYARKYRLTQHKKIAHGDVVECTKNFSCPFHCGAAFRTNKELLSHCDKFHQEQLGSKSLTFLSLREFLCWKEREEEATYSTYVRTQQTYHPSSSDIEARYYYICCRSGKYVHNKKQRKTSKIRKDQKDTRKINDVCISRIYVDELKNGQVNVQYVSAHTGHELGPQELKFLPLPQRTKEEVSTKISQGIPPERILQDIREDVGNRQNREGFDQCVSRRHFLSKSDITNIRVKIDDHMIKRHEDDATSVTLFVSELQGEKFDPVLFFKPQGCKSPKYPNLPEESFILALQTDFQLKLYKQHASSIVCIDSTHGTNQYRFKLITVVVPDDFGKGQPVAWCIADTEASEVIEVFLSCIKARSSTTTVRVLMTDDDNTGWSGAKAVFGDIKHLLCFWHVDRAWKNKLRTVKPENQVEIYQILSILATEIDPSVFEKRMNSFIQIWMPVEPDFVKYFMQNYQNRAEKWAKCYRHFEHGDTDTNMYLESFHNQLKTVHLNGKVNRRVDFLVHHLLEYEKDAFFRYKSARQLPPAMNRREKEEQGRHQRGLKIPPKMVQQTHEGQWKVESMSGRIPSGYMVKHTHSTCAECSPFKGNIRVCRERECGFLCPHMYTCDEKCYDYSNGHICKHIHRLHSLFQQNVSKVPATPSEMDHDDISYAESVFHPHRDYTIQLNTFNSLIQELQDLVTPQNLAVLPYMKHINALIQQAVATCNAAEKADQPSPLPVKEVIPSGKNCELQWRFKQTTKAPGRKKMGLILRHADSEERERIVNKLEDCEVKEHKTVLKICGHEKASNHVHELSTNDTEVHIATIGSKRKRCGECSGCLADDCGTCKFCLDKPKFGGPGKKKKSCVQKICSKLDSKASNKNPKLLSDILNRKSTDKIIQFPSEKVIKGICSPQPKFVRLPGSNVTDIPIPPQLGYAVLVPFLKKQDRAIDGVLGDGNCLFRALSLQLTGDQVHHLNLRRIIAQCESKLKAFEGIHAAINQTKFSEHVKNIRKTCTWGTNVEIIATATLFEIDIYVVSDSYKPGRPTWLKYSPSLSATKELHGSPAIKDLSSTFPVLPQRKNQWLEIAHISRCHFDAIKSITIGDRCRPVLEGCNSAETVEVLDCT